MRIKQKEVYVDCVLGDGGTRFVHVSFNVISHVESGKVVSEQYFSFPVKGLAASFDLCRSWDMRACDM